MKSPISCALLLFVSLWCYPQKTYFEAIGNPDIKENANIVIRLQECDIHLASQRSMTITTRKVYTVLNESGLESMNAYEYYDSNNRIKKIQATVYDASGREVKVFRRKDFKDRSVADGVSVFNDNRLLYLDYTPTAYPFTLAFESEKETSNTAFIPHWMPLEEYYVSTEKSILTVHYPEELGFHYKESNFDSVYNIKKTESPGLLTYSVENLKARKGEQYSPAFTDLCPVVYFRTDKFNLEGVDGEAKTWAEFGKWYYEKILTGTDELPAETQNKIKALVGNEKRPLEIAKIVYKYVQDRTRYVSIQVGIGGFKPMLAKDVDKLGYGDCKALSNYTRSLLKTVGITAYDVIIYGGRDTKSIQSDFVAVQGNHMILTIPDGDQYIWLECTDQKGPFGYSGNFTDNRDALVIKPEGGQIVRTISYTDNKNTQASKGSYIILPDGAMSGSVSIVSEGTQYAGASRTESMSSTEKDDFYKSYFESINNLKLDRINLINNKNSISFTQEIQLSAGNYGTITGNRMMFVPNAFNCNSIAPKRYRIRENPFEIDRGYYDTDEVTIALPEGYEIEAVPNTLETKNKFGEYKAEFIKNSDHSITYKRNLLIRNGKYESKEYDEYRLFCEQVSRNDNAKVVLTKKQ